MRRKADSHPLSQYHATAKTQWRYIAGPRRTLRAIKFMYVSPTSGVAIRARRTFPGESVSIPAFIIPWGSVAPM